MAKMKISLALRMEQVLSINMANSQETNPVKVPLGLAMVPVIPVLVLKMVLAMALEPVNAMEPDQKAVQKAKVKTNPHQSIHKSKKASIK
jgi:hypothetical protein